MSTATQVTAPPRLLVPVVAAAVFISVLTGTMVNVVLPVLREGLGASTAQVGWVVTAYALAYAVAVPLYGRLSDAFGLRRVFVFGLLGFAVGGLVCALAPTLPLLVLGRLVQGLGGAAIPALASVAVTQAFPPGGRGAALGVVATSVGVGSALGPVLGGLAGQLLGWRSLFLGSLALALLLVPVVARVLPTTRSANQARLDLIGGVLLGLTAGLFLYGITQGAAAGFGAPAAWGSLLGATLAAGAFTWRNRRVPDPFVPPTLFRNRAYLTVTATGFLSSLVNLSALVLVPLLLIEVNDLSPALAGVVLTPGAVALALLSPLAGRHSDRIGGLRVVRLGLAFMAVALLGLATVGGGSALWVGVCVLGLEAGFAGIQAPVNNAAAGTLHEADLGVGMGLFTAAFFLGSGAGPALTGALLSGRQASGSQAFNPLYTGPAPAYSDAFLALALVALLALAVSTAARKKAGQP